jgi:hypothetical protein
MSALVKKLNDKKTILNDINEYNVKITEKN